MISKLMLIEQKTFKQLIKNKDNIDINAVKDILQLDPTLSIDIITDDTEIGTYSEWLLNKLYKKYNQLSDTDKNTIKEKLQFYDYQIRSKRIPQQYDNIYKIKSTKELINIVDTIQGDTPITQDPITIALSKHKFKSVTEKPFDLLTRQYYGDIKENGVTKWMVFNPKDKYESTVAGYGASWCTARDDEKNQWSTYIYEGNTAWIFLLSGNYKLTNSDEYARLVKQKLDKVCIIVERGQCQDEDNRVFELIELPEIGKFIEDKIDSWEIRLENHDILDYEKSINHILTGITNPNNRLRLLFNEEKLSTILTTLPKLDKQFYVKHYPELALDIYGVTKENQIKIMNKSSISFQKILEKLIKHNIEIDLDIQRQQMSKSKYFIIEMLKLGIVPHKEIQLQQVNRYPYLFKDLVIKGITPDKDVQLQQVKENGRYIEYIKNPDKDVQLQQVKENWQQIEFIKLPDKDVQLQQVKENGHQIGSIIKNGINPDRDMQLQQVSQNGYQIQYLTNPDKNIQIQQVSQNGNQIEYIENPDKDVQLQQIRQNGHQIKILLDNNIIPDKDVQIQQVSQHAYYITYIIEHGIPLDKDVQMQQVSTSGAYINYIKNPDKDVQMQQVRQNGMQIQYILRKGIIPNKDIQMQQVRNDGKQIYYIPNPPEEIQLQQIKQDPDQYDYIENPTPKQKQLYNQIKNIKESTGYISKLLDVN